MIFVQLLAMGILLHETSGVCRAGLPFLYRNLAPSLGLRLPQAVVGWLNVGLCGGCLTLLFVPGTWPLYFFFFATLLTVAATQPLRMSNHVMIGCFMASLLAMDTLLRPAAARSGPPGELLRAGCIVLALATYWIAFLHKLNREYLSSESSCAWRLSTLYWSDRGVRDGWLPRLSGACGLWGTLALEALLPIFLLIPQTRSAAVIVALLFHFALSFLSVIHFSTCMYAVLICFLPLESVDRAWQQVLVSPRVIDGLIALALVAIVLEFSPSRSFHHRRLARLPQSAFALVSAAAVSVAFRLELPSHLTLPFSELGTAQLWTLWSIGGLFVLNGLAPYLGLKTEFSLAMFSNLRHRPWSHLIFPAPSYKGARYVEIDSLEGLPPADGMPVGSALRASVEYLGKWQTQKFSSYFFYQALDQLGRAGSLAADVRIRWREQGESHELRGLALRSLPRRPPEFGNLFPFMIARDQKKPHCY